MNDRGKKRLLRRDIATILPPFIRDKLIAAAMAPKSIRALEIDRTINRLKLHHPGYFRIEKPED